MKLVMKFGGTSLDNGKKIRDVARLVKSHTHDNGIALVASAMAGITDQLIDLTENARQGATDSVEKTISSLKERHRLALHDAVKNQEIQRKVSEYLKSAIDELEKAATGVSILRELTPHSKDRILSCGERLSTPVVWGALTDVGVQSKYLTGGECGIITDDNFGDALPLMEVTRLQVKETLDPLLGSRIVPAITGYIASTQSGETTTLGRGGSDFTATIVASAIKADAVWIWSDVDGLMTADPKIVPEARLLEEVSYAEAGEMAVFGAKSMHPRALEPAAEQKIPVRIRNTFNPQNEGTKITERTKLDVNRIVKSVALVRDVALITVSGASMVGRPGSAAKIFDVMGRNGVNILMISQSVSESNISMVVKRNMVQRAVNSLEVALLGRGEVKEVVSEDDVNVIAVIGAEMKGTPGIAAKVFGAVASEGINVRMIAQGSSELNISFVVKENDSRGAVRAIHSAFGLGKH